MNSTLHRPDDYRENDIVKCPECKGKKWVYIGNPEDGMEGCDKCNATGLVELTPEEQREKDFENDFEW